MSTSVEEELFQTFRPYCSALASKPSLPILRKITDLVQNSNPDDLTKIQEYIIFPLQLYLRTPIMPENYTLAVIDFIRLFYARVKLKSQFVLKDIISSALTICMKAEKLSEDFKISLNGLFANMFKSAIEDVKIYIYEEDLKLPLSHIVFETLKWAEEDEALDVISTSLSVIKALIAANEDFYCQVYIQRFAPMLPGITTKVVKIIKRNHRQGHKIKTASLTLWTDIVSSIINDNQVFLEPSLDDHEEKNSLLQDPKWVDLAKDHLYTHMQIFATMTTHEHRSVRKALQSLCQALIIHSWNVLRSTRPLQVEILALLCVDHEDQSIRDSSLQNMQKIFAELRQEDEEGGNKVPEWVVELAHAKIFDVSKIVSAPSYMDNLFHEEKTLERHLASLHGFLLMLKSIEDASLFFYSETYVCQLLDALSALLQLEKKSLVASQEVVFLNLRNCDFLFNPELYLNSSRPPDKLFRHLNSTDVLQRVKQIAAVIAQYAKSDLIVSYLTEKMRTRRYSRETILLLNWMILHIRDEALLFELADFYLDFKPVNKLENEEVKALQELRRRQPENKEDNAEDETEWWSERLLITEGLSNIAKSMSALEPTHVKIFDRDYMGRSLVYGLSHVNVTRSHHAHVLFFALHDLAQAAKFANIQTLLDSHSDFMSRQLVLLLRQHFMRSENECGRPAGLPTLLRVVLKLQIQDNALKDVISTLLWQLDLSWMSADPSLTQEILFVISIFVTNLPKINIGKAVQNESVEEKDVGKITKLMKALKYSDDLEEKVLHDDMELPSCPEEGFHKEKDMEESEDLMNDDEEVKIVPENVKFLRETIKHCRHFISMVANPQWQLLSMEIISESMLRIQLEQDELLPLVHQTWQPLRLLFTSNNLFVVEKAFEVLKTMAQTAKDFIRKRTLDDVFPPLVNYLRKLQTMVEDRGLQQTLAARQSRRLLREMTRGLWDFMALLDLSESEVDPIIEHMLNFTRFVEAHPDLIFRNSAGSSSVEEYKAYFKPKRQMDADILWLKLRCINLSESPESSE